MTPAQEFLTFCLQICAAAFSASYLIARFAREVLPLFITEHAGILTFALLFSLGAIDQVLVFPYFRSTLRTLPTFKVRVE